MNRKYVILDASEVPSVDFSKVLQTSAATLMYSVDGSKTFVKFDSEVPSFLEGKTIHSHSEILEIISGTDWVQPK